MHSELHSPAARAGDGRSFTRAKSVDSCCRAVAVPVSSAAVLIPVATAAAKTVLFWMGFSATERAIDCSAPSFRIRDVFGVVGLLQRALLRKQGGLQIPGDKND